MLKCHNDTTNSEALYESASFSQHSRELSALIVSKLYYHLGAYDESLSFALRAGTLFDLAERTEYIETVVGELVFLFHVSDLLAKRNRHSQMYRSVHRITPGGGRR
jgi:hypothetical protein